MFSLINKLRQQTKQGLGSSYSSVIWGARARLAVGLVAPLVSVSIVVVSSASPPLALAFPLALSLAASLALAVVLAEPTATLVVAPVVIVPVSECVSVG